MRVTGRLCFPVAVASLVAACAPSPDVVDGDVEPITNGVEDPGDPAVVAVLVGLEGLRCTGVLVAPRIVVTAGHCIASGEQNVFFGSSLSEGGEFRKVIASRAHPQFDPDKLTFDVGALLLEEDAPVEPVAMWTGDFEEVVGKTVRFVGFGATVFGDTTPAVKRTGSASVAEIDDQKYKIFPMPSQTCLGDSGGPGFFNEGGVEYLSGVTSSGDPMCTEFARFARLDLAREQFIEPFIEITQPDQQSMGEVCFYDANCVTGSCVEAADIAGSGFKYCSRGCEGDDDCLADMTCDGGMCRWPAPTPGAIGTACETSFDCANNLCLAGDEGEPSVCSRACVNDAQCPEDTVCQKMPEGSAAPENACVAPAEEEGCSLSSRSAGGAAVTFVLLALAGLVAQRRRAR